MNEGDIVRIKFDSKVEPEGVRGERGEIVAITRTIDGLDLVYTVRVLDRLVGCHEHEIEVV